MHYLQTVRVSEINSVLRFHNSSNLYNCIQKFKDHFIYTTRNIVCRAKSRTFRVDVSRLRDQNLQRCTNGYLHRRDFPDISVNCVKPSNSSITQLLYTILQKTNEINKHILTQTLSQHVYTHFFRNTRIIKII